MHEPSQLAVRDGFTACVVAESLLSEEARLPTLAHDGVLPFLPVRGADRVRNEPAAARPDHRHRPAAGEAGGDHFVHVRLAVRFAHGEPPVGAHRLLEAGDGEQRVLGESDLSPGPRLEAREGDLQPAATLAIALEDELSVRR